MYSTPKTVNGFTAGLATVGYALLVPATGAVAVARTTAGVYEIGGGAYGANVSGADATNYVLRWDSGETPAVYATDSLIAPAGTTLALTVSSAASPVLNWTADPLATSYEVMRQTKSSAPAVADTKTIIAVIAAGTTTYTDTSPPAGTNYYTIVANH